MAVKQLIECCNLYCRVGRSNKEYHVYIHRVDSNYLIHAEFGPRGRVSQASDKGFYANPVIARNKLASLVKSKRAKGYVESMVARPPTMTSQVLSSATFSTSPLVNLMPEVAETVLDSGLVALKEAMHGVFENLSSVELAAGEESVKKWWEKTVKNATVPTNLPQQITYEPMVVVLGAVALYSQDYVEDALDIADAIVCSKAECAPECKEVLRMLAPSVIESLKAVQNTHPHVKGVGGLLQQLFTKGVNLWFQ